MVYYYTGILPKGIKKNPEDKYTGQQLRYIGTALFSELNGQPEEVVAEALGADKLDGVRKKKCCRRIRSKSKKRSKKRSKRSKKRSKRSKRRSM